MQKRVRGVYAPSPRPTVRAALWLASLAAAPVAALVLGYELLRALLS